MSSWKQWAVDNKRVHEHTQYFKSLWLSHCDVNYCISINQIRSDLPHHAMPSELEIPNGSTHPCYQVCHWGHNFLNNFNGFFIKNQPWHKWFKSNSLTLCQGLFFFFCWKVIQRFVFVMHFVTFITWHWMKLNKPYLNIFRYFLPLVAFGDPTHA